MTASEPQAAPPSQSIDALATNPYIGILGVFLGAGIATLNARLVSVGLPDLRGALGFGFDEASWIPTALNMATMFSGVFVVLPERLCTARAGFCCPPPRSLRLSPRCCPSPRSYWAMLALIVIAGLASGTFLLSHHDLRVDRASQAADHLRDCGLCGGHRFRQQHCLRDRGLVRRASVLALDLLECRALHPVDDDLRLFRNSAAACSRSRGRVGADSLISASASAFFTARWIKASAWTG